MFNIFVLGATGFIGLPVCLALRRAGHIVYGLTRSEGKAKELAKEEILPVVGDATDAKTWIDLALSVDVVIDCADGPVQQGIFDAIKTSLELRPKGSAKLVYIYCSGTWQHGHSPKPVNDLTPGVNPPAIVKFRAALEKDILSARDIMDVLILRPGLVYGGSGSLFGYLWGIIVDAMKRKEMAVNIPGTRDIMLGLVHKQDAAEAFRLFVEKASILTGISHPVFDLVNPPESMGQIMDAAARQLGFKGTVEYRSPESGIEEGICTNVVANSARARDLVGWQPRNVSMTGYIELYVKSFLASSSN